MKLFRFIFILLCALIVMAAVAAWTCPADLAYRLVVDKLGPVRLSGINGSLWDGHAAEVTAFGQPLGALDWQLQAWPLLNREVRLHLNLRDGMVSASGELKRAADAVVSLDEAKFRFPAELLAPVFDIPSLKPVGEIDGTLAHAVVHGGWIDGASGNAQWVGAGMTGAIEARFGDLEAEFSSTADGAISGVARDRGGPLSVNGMFQVRSGQFDANALLEARDNDPKVVDALRYIGEPQGEGSSLLKIHGDLFKLF